MILDVAVVAVILTVGNVAFRQFDPRLSLWRRIVAFIAMLLPVIYIHAIWLPRHGVNGWTGEPREKYYALRGWTLPES